MAKRVWPRETNENVSNQDVEFYEHHGKQVFVRKDKKGQHREHCLCWICGKFYPKSEDMAKNCPMARMFFNLCVILNVVIPVWECPNWMPRLTAKHQMHEK